MIKKFGFLLMVGILIGAAFGLYAFAGRADQDYTPSQVEEASVSMIEDAPGYVEGSIAEEEVSAPDVQTVAAPVLNAPAPAFSLTNLAGEIVSLADYRGDVILLNFWATWCTTCRAEMPDFEAGFARYEEAGFVVLAVNYDEPESLVASYVDELGLSFPVLLDPGANTLSQYRVRGFPTSFIIDADGVIRQIHIGLITDDLLRSYLTEAGLEI